MIWMSVSDKDRLTAAAGLNDASSQNVGIATRIHDQAGPGSRIQNKIAVRLQWSDGPGDYIYGYAKLLFIFSDRAS